MEWATETPMQKKKGQPTCERFLKRHLPIVKWLPNYTFHFFVSDMMAGITAGLTLIPQVIGYAALAGLDPQYGLYGGLMGGFVYLFLGTTPQLCIGPTALVSLLTLTYTQNTNVDMVILLTFLCGCITFLLGVLHLGFLVEFVSGPVVSGFTSAAAVIIASSQVKGLFGLHYNSDDFLSAWVQYFQHVQNTLLTDLCLGIVCITALLLLRKVRDVRVSGVGKPSLSSPHWLSKTLWFITTGRNALVVVTCIIVCYVLENQGSTPFTLTAHITPGLPGFDLPPITTEVNGETLHLHQMIKQLGGGLIVIPMVQVISSVAIAKAFSNGKSVDSTQEIIAMGVCNILSSCVHSLPVAASFTRSAVNQASGVRTQLRGIFTSGLVILALEFITPYFHYIPRATLASVVICSVLFMIEVDVVKPMWNSNRRDLFPALASFVGCLALGVELGLFVGVLVDVCILLYFNARPDIVVEHRTLKSPTGPDVHYWHVQPRGYLLFPAVDHLRDSVTSKTQEDMEEGRKVSGVVLDCSSVLRSDFSASQGIKGIFEDVRNKGYPLVLLGADPKIFQSLTGLCLDIRLSKSKEELYQILHQESLRNKGNATGFSVI